MASEHQRLLPSAHAGSYTTTPTDYNDDSSSLSSSYDSRAKTITVKEELMALLSAAAPLSLTFFLEYLLAVNSLFLIGHLGNEELASASLAVMTFNITGMAVYEGLATCLDTFNAQAFGAGRLYRVGLYTQRCTLMILTASLPIMAFWWYSAYFLAFLVPQRELLQLTQTYLRVLCAGSPGLILFETVKRFLQAQEIFHASTYVLLMALPVNVGLNVGLIHLYGFIGAPIAISITYWLMALLLIAYAVIIDGSQCWNGFSLRAWKHWTAMAKLAVPGLVMIESEYLSFEILTVMASHFGTDALAAQSIISNIGSLTYQLPFACGCAVATRVAIYVGAGSINSAKTATRLGMLLALGVGFFTMTVLIVARRKLALLFSSDERVLQLAIAAMPILAVNQLCDTFNIIAAGVLRSQGRQKIGSILNVLAYYIVALPVAYILSFSCGLEIKGLWLGLGVGIMLLATGEVACVAWSNWRNIIELVKEREEEEHNDIYIDDSTVGSSASSLRSVLSM